MKSFFKRIENIKMSVGQWMLTFVGIVMVRFLLESISNPGISSSKIISSDPFPFAHYILFFVSAVFGSMVIIEYLTAKKSKVANLMLFFLPAMWIAPILDMLFSRGSSAELRYVAFSGVELLKDFLTFFGYSFKQGATLGIRIEIFFILCGISWIVWHFTQNKIKTGVAFLSTYVLVFFMAGLPGFIYTFAKIFGNVSQGMSAVSVYLANIILRSNIAYSLSNSALLPASQARFLEMGFDKLMAQFFFLFSILFIFWWFWRVKKEKLLAILKNSRPERAGHYLILMILGVVYAIFAGFGKISVWVDIISLLCLAVSWYCFWVFSVNLNDCEDLETDKISNKNRPLVEGLLTESEMKQSALIFFVMSLFGSWSLGYAQFYMICIASSASYIYSIRNFRLKIFPGVATFLMALASLASVLSGFFLISSNKTFAIFPAVYMIGILVFYTLMFNVKDLKDAEGDAQVGVLTIPVLFPKYQKEIVGGLFALAFILLPLFAQNWWLYLTSVPAGGLGYYFATRQNYKEKPVFIVYFCFILLSAILLA